MKKKLGENWKFVLLLGIVAAATYIRFRNAFFQGMWVDEARYARAGVDLARHMLNYTVSWKGQVSFFQPLFPYMIAVANFFTDPDTAARIVSPLVSVGGVVTSYFLGREMKDGETGLIVAALVAVNPIYWFLSTRVLIGATLTALYTLTMLALFYGLENRRYSSYVLWTVGPLAALTYLSKQPGATLGFVIPVYFLYINREQLKAFIVEGEGIRESGLEKVFLDRDIWISGLAGLTLMSPWILRNLKVCGFPFCGLMRALDWGTRSGGLDIQGTFFFIQQLPTVITLPLAVVLALQVSRYFIEHLQENPDFLVKYVAITSLATGITYILSSKLLPFVLLTSIAIVATTKHEKLLWIWIGTGIGFMSVPGTKLPRYIVFTVPAMITVASILVRDASMLLDSKAGDLSAGKLVLLLIAAPIVAFSFTQGSAMVSGHSFQQLEPAGRWIASNHGNTSISATSVMQMRYFARPGHAEKITHNRSNLRESLIERDVDFVEADVYERAQPEWTMTGIPPYRLSRETIRKLRNREISPQKVISGYGEAPGYLEPVKSFGSTAVPLFQNRTQPQVIIYRVNRSALRNR